ncbi:MFS transporter [Rhodococcus opacus]|uniref:MFS transporter n=1 Tax=Rhodococcus opacus TaxID=37919 RepID=UPI000EA9FEE7|nr:MFS transporter [Rhodococcus opacus]QZS52442.1 MFS transporter [Rhodococcus opacus]RKM65012.1 aromatic acid/H+ symport family MFS transporter [Rhodococcus opacus]
MDLREAIRTQTMRRYQIQTITICFILCVVDGFEILMMAFVAPYLGREWNLGSVEIGFLLSASIIGTALGAILISPLTDKIGRRRLMIACLVGITIGMALSAAAPNLPALIIFRVFTGLGIGGIVSNLNILVSEYSSERRRGTALGLYGTGLPLGSALGGVVTTVLCTHFGWRSAFVFGAAVTAVLLLVVIRSLPESVDYLIEKRPKNALRQYNTIAARLGYPTATELPSAPPRPAHLIRHSLFTGVMLRRTVFLWAGYSCLVAAFYFANTWTPKLVTDATGDVSTGATAGVLVSVGGVAGALLFAGLSLVIQPRHALILLMCGGALSYIGYASGYHVVALAMLLAVAVGIFTTGGMAGFYAVSPSVYPAAARGTGVGWMIGCGRTISILAPILTGYLLDLGWTPNGLYMAFSAVLVSAGTAVWLLDVTFRSHANPPIADARQPEVAREP